MIRLTATQKVALSLSATDAKGNPAPVENVEWVSSDESILTVTEDPGNELVAVAVAVGPVGTAQLQVTADSRIGPDERVITGAETFEIVAGEAQIISVAAGTPEEQTP